MQGLFYASICLDNGIFGGNLRLGPGGLSFTTQKIQIPRNMREVFIPYAGITGVETSRVAGFPSVLLSTDTGQTWEFVLFSRKKFLSALAAHRIQSR